MLGARLQERSGTVVVVSLLHTRPSSVSIWFVRVVWLERGHVQAYVATTNVECGEVGMRGTRRTHDPVRQFASPYAYGPWDPVNGTDPTGAVFGLEALIAWAVVLLAAAVDVGGTGDLVAAASSRWGIDAEEIPRRSPVARETFPLRLRGVRG
ncbi:MAG: hypothetical protein KatS3mg077_2906 [Candidatus Binatia bacterium]|nr:MAG: hypothetical protein KatS3mg077_2906 [Candidatus Binatia bacterium]